MMAQAEPYKRDAPSVTVFLFAYNQSKYIRAACESVLAQDYTPLQIVFSDDCSTDDTFDIMSEIAQNYQGLHQIRLNRNAQNLGLIRHVNLSHQLATTELLVAAAGDDISELNRVTEIVKAYRQAPIAPCSIHSDINPIDLKGDTTLFDVRPEINYSEKNMPHVSLAMELIIGATHAWSKEVFEVFGDITELNAYEDLVLAYRSALLNKIIYIDQKLVRYRVGSGMTTSVTSKKTKKINQKKRQIKYLGIESSVLSQRIKDAKLIGRNDLAELMQKNLNRLQLTLTIYESPFSFFSTLQYAANQDLIILFFKHFFRKIRKGW